MDNMNEKESEIFVKLIQEAAIKAGKIVLSPEEIKLNDLVDEYHAKRIAILEGWLERNRSEKKETKEEAS